MKRAVITPSAISLCDQLSRIMFNEIKLIIAAKSLKIIKIMQKETKQLSIK